MWHPYLNLFDAEVLLRVELLDVMFLNSTADSDHHQFQDLPSKNVAVRDAPWKSTFGHTRGRLLANWGRSEAATWPAPKYTTWNLDQPSFLRNRSQHQPVNTWSKCWGKEVLPNGGAACVECLQASHEVITLCTEGRVGEGTDWKCTNQATIVLFFFW